MEIGCEYQDGSRAHTGRPGLSSLLGLWDSMAGALLGDEIQRGLARLTLDRNDLRDGVNFNERAYQRNLIHDTETYEVLVLCWRSGQHSPIHDHGRSTCGVLVIEGVATETIFGAEPGKPLIEARSCRFGAGSVMVSRGGDIHRVANLESAGIDLITLHVYSPALHGNRYYRIDGAELPTGPRSCSLYPETIVAPLRSRSARNRDMVDPQAGG